MHSCVERPRAPVHVRVLQRTSDVPYIYISYTAGEGILLHGREEGACYERGLSNGGDTFGFEIRPRTQKLLTVRVREFVY